MTRTGLRLLSFLSLSVLVFSSSVSSDNSLQLQTAENSEKLALGSEVQATVENNDQVVLVEVESGDWAPKIAAKIVKKEEKKITSKEAYLAANKLAVEARIASEKAEKAQLEAVKKDLEAKKAIADLKIKKKSPVFVKVYSFTFLNVMIDFARTSKEGKFSGRKSNDCCK